MLFSSKEIFEKEKQKQENVKENNTINGYSDDFIPINKKNHLKYFKK